MASLTLTFTECRQDEQPPFRFTNRSGVELDVGLFLPQPDAAGGFGYAEPASLAHIAPACVQESAMPQFRKDGEDHDVGSRTAGVPSGRSWVSAARGGRVGLYHNILSIELPLYRYHFAPSGD